MPWGLSEMYLRAHLAERTRAVLVEGGGKQLTERKGRLWQVRNGGNRLLGRLGR